MLRSGLFVGEHSASKPRYRATDAGGCTVCCLERCSGSAELLGICRAFYFYNRKSWVNLAKKAIDESCSSSKFQVPQIGFVPEVVNQVKSIELRWKGFVVEGTLMNKTKTPISRYLVDELNVWNAKKNESCC